ncbi:enoyl-CoA hydratase/isomerase family protein [Hoeflea prorocentri]|uniref:Enoyl-CoA hydratase/isomerase family protein n=1 Tax=Hoeflea prorocentri TaxID=1922333 RepID=A0A9X3UKE8_9HYPH|nr:enoyl-CoA hydratase/isomerase family protein [Hoeflea prorocentri]MCY6382284.1 enoyl-CoA hydratase/isomerase family protein [Hoeflea prorocentri]MDA5400084.1 enoyl-CoA hydratase/isomerase family protein [Hoeflea prorocentri]
MHLRRSGATAELRLDNPTKLNALTAGMLAEIERHCGALEMDASVRAVVISAEESRAFCAGADILAWSALSPRDFARHWVRDGHRIFDRLARLSKPTIAAINGHAFGGGLEFAAVADLRVMSPEATLALPEADVGIVPGWSGTQRLIRLLGEPLVKEMALFGRRITPERALSAGFIAEISDDPLARAREIAEALSSRSSQATEVAKYMIHAAVGEDRDAMIEALGAGMIGPTQDRAEGVAAFREKRKPNFSGT